MRLRLLTVFLVSVVSVSHCFAQMNTGIDYINGGMYQTAKSFFKKQMNDPLLKADACYYMGEVYRLTANADSASFYYNSGLQTNPDNALCSVGKASLLFSKSEQEAEDLIKKALKSDKKNAALRVAVAKAYLANNKQDKAVSYLSDAHDLDKKNTAAYLLEGDIFLAKLNGGDAANKYEMAIYFDKDCKAAYVKLASLHFAAKNYDMAGSALDKLKAIDPNYAPALKVQGEIAFAQNQFEDAATAYAEYIKSPEATPADYTRYASILYFKKDYPTSIDIAKKALLSDPNNIVMQRILGYDLYETKDYTNGLSQMEGFMKNAKPEDFIALDYIYYARLLVQNGKDSLAIDYFRKALSMDNTKVELNKEIILAYEKMKKYEEAATEYEAYVKVIQTPLNSDLFSWGTDNYFAGGAIDSVMIAKDPQLAGKKKAFLTKADSLFHQLTIVLPDNYRGYFWQGRTNALMDPETTQGLAKPYYEKAAEILEKSGLLPNYLIESYQYLGYYYYLKNDKDNTRKYFEKVLALDPNNANAKKVLDQYK